MRPPCQWCGRTRPAPAAPAKGWLGPWVPGWHTHPSVDTHVEPRVCQRACGSCGCAHVEPFQLDVTEADAFAVCMLLAMAEHRRRDIAKAMATARKCHVHRRLLAVALILCPGICWCSSSEATKSAPSNADSDTHSQQDEPGSNRREVGPNGQPPTPTTVESCTETDTDMRHFVYEIDDEFREMGSRDCSTMACAFGNASTVDGVDVYDTNQFDLAWLFLHRLSVSKQRTLRVEDADVFFVPMWPRVGSTACNSHKSITAKLLPELKEQNPLLARDAFPHPVARRHFVVDPRAETLCSYMYNVGSQSGGSNSTEAFDYFARVSLEKNYPLHHTTWPESMYGPQILDHPSPSMPKYPSFPDSSHLWQVE